MATFFVCISACALIFPVMCIISDTLCMLTE